VLACGERIGGDSGEDSVGTQCHPFHWALGRDSMGTQMLDCHTSFSERKDREVILKRGSVKYRILPVLHPDSSSRASLGIMGVMYKSDIEWDLLTSCVNPAYSSYCMDKAFSQAGVIRRVSLADCGHRLQNSACNVSIGGGRRRISGAEA
jgi:hypothetical protein